MSNKRYANELDDEIKIVDLDANSNPLSLPWSIIREISLRNNLYKKLIARIVLICFFILLLVVPPGLQSSVPVPLATSYKSIATSSDQGITYIGSPTGNLSAYRSHNGIMLWQHLLPQNYIRLEASHDMLFLASMQGTKHIIEARRTTDGSLLWSHSMSDLGPIPFITSKSAIFVHTQDGNIHTFRSEDGVLLWRHQSEQSMPMDAFLWATDEFVSLRVNGDAVVVKRISDGSLIKRYQYTGWNWRPHIENKNLFLVTDTDIIQSHDSERGNLQWEHGPLGYKIVSWLIQHGIVYISMENNILLALHSHNGTILWQTQTKRLVYIVATTQSEIVMYSDNERYYGALHIKDGSFLWERQLDTPQMHMMADNKIIFTGDDHTIYAWHANTGEFAWKYISINSILWQPEIIDGLLYVRQMNGRLDVVQVKDGRRLWNYTL